MNAERNPYKHGFKIDLFPLLSIACDHGDAERMQKGLQA